MVDLTKGYRPDEFEDGLTLAGADVGAIPPPAAANEKARGQAYVPDQYDDGRTIAGADVGIIAPPSAQAQGAGATSARTIEGAGAASFFLRLRRTDGGGFEKTFQGVEVITIGRGTDQVLAMDHELLAESHARIVFRGGTYELSPLEGQELLVNGRKLEGSITLAVEDKILFVGEGGPALSVEMMYPLRERKQGALPGPLAALDPLFAPLAEKFGVDPAFLLFGGIHACCGLVIILGVAMGLRAFL